MRLVRQILPLCPDCGAFSAGCEGASDHLFLDPDSGDVMRFEVGYLVCDCGARWESCALGADYQYIGPIEDTP